MLNLMMITNSPELAISAEKAGVDRIFVDLEQLGKEKRQPGDTVKSQHTFEDIEKVKSVLTSSDLLVRVNPMYEGSYKEIERVLEFEPDYIILPYFKSLQEVQNFINIVDGRAKIILLFETKEAVSIIDEILSLDGISEAYIGLNDLHISYGKRFMFELLTDGTVSKLSKKFKDKGLVFGFGGIGNINGQALISPEKILCAHLFFESKTVILSRTFIKNRPNSVSIDTYLKDEVNQIRNYEKKISSYSKEYLLENQIELEKDVQAVIEDNFS